MALSADPNFEESRERLRRAVRSIAVDSSLRARVRRQVEASRLTPRWRALIAWLLAPVLLAALIFQWEQHRFDYALEAHLACALRGELPIRPVKDEPLTAALPTRYQVKHIHICRMGNREFLHAVLVRDQRTISAILSPVEFAQFPPWSTIHSDGAFEYATIRAGGKWLHVVGETGSADLARLILGKLAANSNFLQQSHESRLTAQGLQLRILTHP